MKPYRPIILPNDATKCPHCGRPIISKERCWLCQMTFCSASDLPPIDPTVLYITIFTFIGWVGVGPTFFIAINTDTKEYAAEMASQKEKRKIGLPEELVDELVSQSLSGELFNMVFPEDNEIWYDCSSFTISLQKGEVTFEESFRDERLKLWPIIDQVFNTLKKEI